MNTSDLDFDPFLTKTQCKLTKLIMDFNNADSDCYCSYEWFAKKSGRASGTARNNLRILRDKGYIKIIKMGRLRIFVANISKILVQKYAKFVSKSCSIIHKKGKRKDEPYIILKINHIYCLFIRRYSLGRG